MTHHKFLEQPETESITSSSELMARLKPPTQEAASHEAPAARPRGRVNPTARASNSSTTLQSLKTSSLTSVVLLLVLVFGRLDCVLCKPNNQQQLTDKQLLRKAFESGGESSRGNPNNNNNNEQTSSSPRTNQQNNGDQNNSPGASTQTFACPEQFGYYTDTKDCTKYYVCVFGEVLHESCTGGLRFSRELQTCDWPRNVDCPQGTSSSSSTSESSTSATPSSSTAPTPTTTTSSTTTTSTSSSSSTSSPTSTSTTTASATTTMKSVGGSGGGNSQITAFADEANDPQQPSFDEAISPVITADGAIHLHDGQGGTFGLAPNHNRALAGSSPQSADSPADAANLHSSQVSRGGQNVDVFVMPLQLAHAHANNNRAHQARNNQQVNNKRQLSSTQSQTATRQQQQQQQQNQKVLQAATLPPARNLAPNFRESSGELNDESGDFNLSASNGANDDSSAAGDSPAADSTTADAAGQPQLGGDSLGAQADSADNEQPDGGNNGSLLNSPGELPDSSAPSNDDSTSDSANADPADDNSNDNSGAYVPPVAGPPLSSTTTTTTSTTISRQPSSQLLSINNRQIVDPTRQTFKPIPSPASSAGQLISSSQPQNMRPAIQSANQQRAQQQQQQQQQLANTNNRQMNRDQQQQLQAQAARQSRAGANSFPAPVAQPAPPTQQLRPARPPPSTPARQFFVPPNNNNNQQLVSSNVNFNEPPTPPTQVKPRLQAASQPMSRQQQQLPVSTFTQRFPSAPQQQQQQQVTSSQRSQNVQLFLQQQRPQQFSAQFNGPPLSPFEEVQPFANTSSADELPQIFQQSPAMANFAPPAAQQQQQQRRSRPPKRHQIPNSATVATTSMSTASVVSSSSRRPPLQQQQQQQDFDPTTTTTSTSTMSTPRNQFTSGDQLDDGADEQQSRNARPVTTSSQFSPTPDFLAPTPPTRQRASSSTTTLATPTSSSTQRHRLLRPTTPTAPLLTTALTTPTTPPIETAEPAAGAAAQGTSGGGDPQTVANRYLNSAIDALEAGQPFGTVDYDFDILSDNSTERRGGGERAANLTIADDAAARPVNSLDAPPSSSEAPPPTRPTPVVPTLSRPRGPTRAEAAQAARDQQAAVAAAAAPPTKKPRPTNKKIVVNHEQALANNRASTEPARRPEALYATPAALATASKCDARSCRLPDCKCGDTLVPGGLESKQIPQVVLLTFDDAVNDLNWEIYEELFSGRVNPNGCPVLATFYVSHEWTDYGQVQTLYSRGHEMASHSVTHSFGEKFSKSQWFKEINGQREILNMYGGVKMNDVRGMRAPFLQIGGNKMFEMLYDANFTYDSSMPIFENSPPLWPYTLDYQLAHECMITPCPTKSFPGVWEVGMTMWVDLRGGRCSMGDACSNPTDEDGVYEMLMKNFNRHYKSNRAPFGLFYHSAWFNTVHHRRGFLRFMATVNALPEVFFVTNWQMLQWMRQPTPLSEINSFEPWQCPAKNDRPPPCYHPAVCNVKSEHGTRFMKTCQPCPANQQYPWVGATGFNKSNNNKPSGSG